MSLFCQMSSKKEIVKLGCSCYLFHGHLEAFIFLTAGSVRQCRPKLPQKGFITVIVGLIVAKFVCDDHDDYWWVAWPSWMIFVASVLRYISFFFFFCLFHLFIIFFIYIFFIFYYSFCRVAWVRRKPDSCWWYIFEVWEV